METEQEKRKHKYLNTEGLKCLFCRSDDVSNDGPAWDDPLTIKVSCNDCGKSWRDVYTLVDVVEE